MPGTARFDIYRYQILPIEQTVQLQFGDEVLDIEQLKARKNELFHDAIVSISSFLWARAELEHRVLLDQDSRMIFRIGASRALRRTTRDFEQETVEDWPNALVYVDNRPDHQLMAIQVEYKAFRKPRTLARILERNINDSLRKYLLNAVILPVFDQHEFWHLVDKYPKRITQVRFDMVTPNMSNISKSLQLDLTALGRDTNTQETTLELNSVKGSHLVLSSANEFLKSLVDYVSAGGGSVWLKVRDIGRRLSTKDSVKEIDIGELDMASLEEAQSRQLVHRIDEATNG